MQKVFIVGGGGMVGASAAYAIALQEIVEEVVLIDINEEAAWGQATDINDAMAFSNGIKVRTGKYDEIADDDIVVITSGVPQKPGQSRLELLGINASIVHDVIANIMTHCKQPFIIMVANPVDVLTYVALKSSGLPKSRVFGTGTTLDSFRLRVKLADALDLADNAVEAYVLGEHGDSSFAAISGARIGDIPLADYPDFDPETVAHIDDDIRQQAYKVIQAKHSTYFAIGQVVAYIVEAMQHGPAKILPLCSLAEGEYGLSNVVLGLPHTIDSDGTQIVSGYPLSDSERQALESSASVIREAIASLDENVLKTVC